MPDDLNPMMSGTGGNAGTQRDFLDECGELAFPGGSGTHGNAPTQLRSCVPERSQTRWERNSTGNSGDSALRSRVPSESTHINDHLDDWDADARKLIAALPDESLRVLLTDYFEETAATLEYEQMLTRQAAEQNAFGLLLFQLLKCGIDARATSNHPNQELP